MLLSTNMKIVLFVKLLSCKDRRKTNEFESMIIANTCIETLLIRGIIKSYFEKDFLSFCDRLGLGLEFKRLMRIGSKHRKIFKILQRQLQEFREALDIEGISNLLELEDCSHEYSLLLKEVKSKHFMIALFHKESNENTRGAIFKNKNLCNKKYVSINKNPTKKRLKIQNKFREEKIINVIWVKSITEKWIIYYDFRLLRLCNTTT